MVCLIEIFCPNSGPSESSPPVGRDLVPNLTAALFKATVTHGGFPTLNWPLTSLNPSLGSRDGLNYLLVSVFIHLTLRYVKKIIWADNKGLSRFSVQIPKNQGSI